MAKAEMWACVKWAPTSLSASRRACPSRAPLWDGRSAASADAVQLARQENGEHAPLRHALEDGEDVAVNDRGYIEADPVTFETSVPGVYAGGDVVNDGIHQIDVSVWAMGDRYPKRVVATGGMFYYDDDHETPDTLMAIFDYEDGQIIFEASGISRQDEL